MFYAIFFLFFRNDTLAILVGFFIVFGVRKYNKRNEKFRLKKIKKLGEESEINFIKGGSTREVV